MKLDIRTIESLNLYAVTVKQATERDTKHVLARSMSKAIAAVEEKVGHYWTVMYAELLTGRNLGTPADPKLNVLVVPI